jgi:glycosyltransferase involved in cell wall biosynthesis
MSPAAVSIILPTQRRPASLARAAGSALAQTGVDPASLELVVVDNDSAPSALDVVARLAQGAPFPVRYVHEPRLGVAFARNAGVAAAEGELIAFLDDDEEAPAGWLAALLKVQADYGADAVFGPVRARAPASVRWHRDYLEQFFSRLSPAGAGLIDRYYGCGDSLVRRGALPDPRAPFSDARNHTGGEDDLLFGQMKARGARFAWAPDAWVWEDPVPERLTLRYTLLRAFTYGQGPPSHCAAKDPPDWTGVVGWMAMGLVQALAFGVLAAISWTIGARRRAFTLDRACRGLGKLLWWKPFKIKFYGLAADERTPAAGAPPGGV